MFSLFKDEETNEKEQAQILFEKISASKATTRDAHSARVRMGLLSRAHLDKTFIEGAQKTAIFYELSALATLNQTEKPEKPEFNVFQRVKTLDKEIWVYLPEEYAEEAFNIGASYQRTDIDAKTAIERMQFIADQICLYELKLDAPFEVLQFLRDEIAGKPDTPEAADSNTPSPTQGN